MMCLLLHRACCLLLAAQLVVSSGAQAASSSDTALPTGCSIECVDLFSRDSARPTERGADLDQYTNVDRKIEELYRQYAGERQFWNQAHDFALAGTVLAGYVGELGSPWLKAIEPLLVAGGVKGTELLDRAGDAAVEKIIASGLEAAKVAHPVEFANYSRDPSDLKSIRDFLFGSNNAFFDNESLKSIDEKDRGPIRDVKDDVLRQAVTNVARGVVDNTVALRGVVENYKALQNEVTNINGAIERQNKSIADLKSDLNRTKAVLGTAVIQNAYDIELTQRTMYERMTPLQQKQALEGGFLRSLSDEQRRAMITQLEPLARIQEIGLDARDVANGMEAVAGILDKLNIDRKVVKAVNVGAKFLSGASTVALGYATGNPVAMVQGVGSIMSAFSGGDPDAQRHAAIMAALAEISRELRELRVEMQQFRQETRDWFISTQRLMRALHGEEMAELRTIEELVKGLDRDSGFVMWQRGENLCPDVVRSTYSGNMSFALLTTQRDSVGNLRHCELALRGILPARPILSGQALVPFELRRSPDDLPDDVRETVGPDDYERMLWSLRRRAQRTYEYANAFVAPNEKSAVLRSMLSGTVSYRSFNEIVAGDSERIIGSPSLDWFAQPLATENVARAIKLAVQMSQVMAVSEAMPDDSLRIASPESLARADFMAATSVARELLSRAEYAAELGVAQERLGTGAMFADLLVEGIDKVLEEQPVILPSLRSAIDEPADCRETFQALLDHEATYQTIWQKCAMPRKEFGARTLCVMDANKVLAANALTKWVIARLGRSMKPMNDPQFDGGPVSTEFYARALRRSDARLLTVALGSDAKVVRRIPATGNPVWSLRLPRIYLHAPEEKPAPSADKSAAPSPLKPTRCFVDYPLPPAEAVGSGFLVRGPDLAKYEELIRAAQIQKTRVAPLTAWSAAERAALENALILGLN